MRRFAARWVDLFRGLGEALIDLVRAEIDQLLSDLAASGRHLAVALALFGVAGAIVFWALAVLILAGVAALALWLPPWAAALVVAGVLLAAAGLVCWLAWRKLRRLESPRRTTERRWAEHREWWEREVVGAADRDAARLTGSRTAEHDPEKR